MTRCWRRRRAVCLTLMSGISVINVQQQYCCCTTTQQQQGLPPPSGEGSSSSSRRRNCGPLFRVAWHRIVLDQVDTLAYQAAEARAASMLVARHGWCLTEPDTLQGVGSLSHCFRYGYANPYLCKHIPAAHTPKVNSFCINHAPLVCMQVPAEAA
jgi:hypothetical protein